MRTVAHCVPTYLPVTCNWIYTQLCGLKSFRPVVFAGGLENLQEFPLEPVRSFLSLPPGVNLLNRAVRRLRQQHLPLFTHAMREEHVELIHAHFGDEGYRWLWTRRCLNVPLITTFYGFDMSQLSRLKVWRSRLTKLFSEGSLFLCEGPHMRQSLIRLGCDPGKVVIQHLGVNLNKMHFTPRTRPEAGPVQLLMAASFREKKGIAYALEAVAALKMKHNLSLTIVGDGELRGAIQEQIARLQLGAVVKLLGYQPPRVLFEIAQGAHIFLSPSVTARNGDSEGGAPVVLMEMQAMGLPVVATYHADIPEVVVDGKSGLLVKERDSEGLARALDYLLEHPETWPTMGKCGRDYIEREFHIDARMARLEDLYARVLDHHQESADVRIQAKETVHASD